MKRIAKFYKVSFEQFEESWKDDFPETSPEEIREIYEKIKLPARATKGSAGYDFFSPIDFELKPGETLKIPTGIRVSMEEDWVLCIFPRSGLGFKYRLQMNNTVGVIDSDYYDSDNEGHIFLKIDLKKLQILRRQLPNGFLQKSFPGFPADFSQKQLQIQSFKVCHRS